MYLMDPASKFDVFGLTERTFVCTFIKSQFFDRRKVLMVGRFSFAKLLFITVLLPSKTFRRARKTFRRWSIPTDRLEREQVWLNENRIAEKTRRSAENGGLARMSDFMIAVWSTRL